MTNLQPFEELVEKAKAEWIERHPELSPDNRGVDPNIIVDIQAKQLLKANKNAEGWIASHRRDQAKIVGLKNALKKQMEWTNELVAERDEKIELLASIISHLRSLFDLIDLGKVSPSQAILIREARKLIDRIFVTESQA